MAGVLVGAVSCARCGGPIRSTTDLCPGCGTSLVPAAGGEVLGTYSPLLAGVARSGVGRRRIGVAIDLAPVAVAVVVGLVQLVSGTWGGFAGLVWTAAGLAAYGLALAILLAVRGRSLGRFLLRLRTVDDLTGSPISVRTVLSRLSASHLTPRTVSADLARGRDPLDLALPSVPAAALSEGSSLDAALFSLGAAAERTPVQAADAVAIVFDTGRRQLIHDSLLIGRSPELKHLNDREADHPTLALADLSRTLAKTHALIEWSGSVLWVTDLSSAHGSVLVSPDGDRRTLVPGIRGPAAIGWTVLCGNRSFSVHAVTTKGEAG